MACNIGTDVDVTSLFYLVLLKQPIFGIFGTAEFVRSPFSYRQYRSEFRGPHSPPWPNLRTILIIIKIVKPIVMELRSQIPTDILRSRVWMENSFVINALRRREILGQEHYY